MLKRISFLLIALIGLVGCNNDSDTVECANGQCQLHHHHHGAAVAQDAAPAPTAPVIVVTPPPVVVSPMPAPVVAVPENAAPTTGGTKRAVIVGINVYSDPGAPGLQGCVPDAESIYVKCTGDLSKYPDDVAFLKPYAVNTWGFIPDCCVVILDEKATKAAVTQALVDAVAASKPGDTLLYWQSSHGAEDAISADADSQPDHMNQIACMTDFAWDREHEMIDEDFVAIFSKLPPGVLFNWASDSCHSGDLDRNVGHHKHPVRAKSPTPPEKVRIRVKKAQINHVASRDLVGGILDVGFISGCKSDQTSADSQDDFGHPCGALTHYFLTTIDAHANDPITKEASALDTALAADGYDQMPQSSGRRKTKPWLKN